MESAVNFFSIPKDRVSTQYTKCDLNFIFRSTYGKSALVFQKRQLSRLVGALEMISKLQFRLLINVPSIYRPNLQKVDRGN